MAMVQEESVFHHAYSSRVRCEIAVRINHVIHLSVNVLLASRGLIISVGEGHELPRHDIRIASVGLPDLQNTILVVVMNRCADDHGGQRHASLLAGARNDHCCCRIVIFLQWICKIQLRIWKDQGRIIPARAAVEAHEERLVFSIRGRKRYGGSLDAILSAA
jgi:hypothetical protein